ncbi:hypothetical protein [Mycoplasmopsis cricetuli]|uniref:hypothetical protein n=1 Tax=Mycoplasmopsis cricetuli TaxID=171283 RepID=UPI0004719901|nr:hypothetical protein [Mycoplasmopsis cricetuli]
MFSKSNFNYIGAQRNYSSKYLAHVLIVFVAGIFLFGVISIGSFFTFKNGNGFFSFLSPSNLVYIILIGMIPWFIVNWTYSRRANPGWSLTIIYFIFNITIMPIYIGFGLWYIQAQFWTIILIFGIPIIVMAIAAVLAIFDLVDLRKLSVFVSILSVAFIVAIIISFILLFIPISAPRRGIQVAVSTLGIAIVSLLSIFTWRKLLLKAENTAAFTSSVYILDVIREGIELLILYMTLVFHIVNLLMRITKR